jgi:hypothetical protein
MTENDPKRKKAFLVSSRSETFELICGWSERFGGSRVTAPGTTCFPDKGRHEGK